MMFVKGRGVMNLYFSPILGRPRTSCSQTLGNWILLFIFYRMKVNECIGLLLQYNKVPQTWKFKTTQMY